ncbi:MAG: DUF2190 family protein [Hyphomicrobiales bacterium]
MKNYVQPGNTVTLPAPYDVTSGDGLLVGALFGVASANAAKGTRVETNLTGVFELKTDGALSVGDKAYWNDAKKAVTKTAASNTVIGVAVSNSTGNAAQIRLNGGV